VADAVDPVAAAELLLGDTPLAAEAGSRSIVLAPSLIVRPFTYVLDESDRLSFIYPAALPAGGEAVELNGRVLAVARALGDEMRLQLVAMLRDREATLRELMADTGWPRSTLRHHLGHLVAAGIIAGSGTGSGGTARSGASGGTRYRLRETALPDLAELLRRFLDGR
jgi:DNA-binding transcriptional ArsR family regulator